MVVGASGFLGSRLLALAPRDTDLVGTGWRRPVRPGRWRDALLDVSSPSGVAALFERERPDAVIYCAYDKSDRAITVDGAVEAARLAERSGAKFLFVSTDLVFDGRSGNYAETSPARPVMAYGQLKVEAEALVRVAHSMAIVVRPSLLVGESWDQLRPGYECEALRDGRSVDLYVDEWRSPVAVDDAARAIWELTGRDLSGVYHVGGPERLSRFELGRVLCELHGFDPTLLRQAARPPDRPADTSLNSDLIVGLLGWAPRRVSSLAPSKLAAAGD